MSTKNQKIDRKHLAEIYPSVCDKWQKRITELVLNQSGDTIEVGNALIFEASESATESNHKKFIEKHFKIISDRIQDRIKNLKDVYKELGLKREDLIPFINPKTKLQKQLNAVVDINHISLAFNQGWLPDFKNGNEAKYYPYFKLGSSGWVVNRYLYVDGCACMGSGFYFRTSDLALYAGKQFLDVYIDYLP